MADIEDLAPALLDDHVRRRLPIGAEPQAAGGVHFRLWAPRCRGVVVETEGLAPAALKPEAGGYFAGLVQHARPGMRYRLRLDDAERAFPDPASRFQPEGPHGPSQIVDPDAFTWSDGAWGGVPRENLVIYEVHVGTFTPAGTWRAAAAELAELAALGITCIEMMPVGDFPGRFGWGYDGVNLFAPSRLYGTPDDLRAFVDAAHRVGIAVILDVVYNHFGPSGNYLGCFAGDYCTDRYKNEWGEAINFDGPNSGPVREFFIANAGYWVDEYHFDGLRLDATQQIFDRSETHILAEIVRRVRAAAPERITTVIGENEPQHARLVRAVERGGYGLDALWNDDFHHAASVALTGRNEAYYSDYRGRPSEFVAAAKHGFLYQGQRYPWQRQNRGTPALDLPAEAFVVFLQNHDQVANSWAGLRVHALTSAGALRAMTAYLLLMPGIPMLFQGQEFAASSPFLYFADHEPDLSPKVRAGRREFLAQFPSIASPEATAALADPGDIATFRRSILDLGERERHQEMYALHRDLLALRHDDPVLSQRPCRVDGGVLADCVWFLRYFAEDGADRVMIVNLGIDVTLAPMPEPLLAPPSGTSWRVLWSSEAIRYGGGGIPRLYREHNLHIPGRSALVLAPGLGGEDGEAPDG
ncbi:MAG TPA: malto-oligosyltrehalose trehalohydrolase [Stellaceae bacterium]|nr:malto-oligosyltrehalose trehalohydrolase [Stellaceae bacterium]